MSATPEDPAPDPGRKTPDENAGDDVDREFDDDFEALNRDPTRRRDTKARRREDAARTEEVYRRLTELVQTKGYLSVEEARELLRYLESETSSKMVGYYQLIELLGEGATASVYRAVDVRIRRIVSLKVLSKESLNDPLLHKHFVRETKAVMLLQHPNIVRGLEIGDTREYCFIAIEYVDGRTLRDLVVKMGALGELESIYILKQIAYALEYTHRLDLVHLDIKPENILIDDNTLQARLFDLGMLRDRSDPDIATITEAPVHPRYSSPEIIAGMPGVDVRSDLYSLGLCFFYMLTGEHAFVNPRNPLEVEVDRQQLQERLQAVRPALTERTIHVVMEMTEYRFRDRPRSPAALIDRLIDVDPFEGLAAVPGDAD